MKIIAIVEAKSDTIYTYIMSDKSFHEMMAEVEKYPEVSPRCIVSTMRESMCLDSNDRPECVGIKPYDAVFS